MSQGFTVGGKPGGLWMANRRPVWQDGVSLGRHEHGWCGWLLALDTWDTRFLLPGGSVRRLSDLSHLALTGPSSWEEEEGLGREANIFGLVSTRGRERSGAARSESHGAPSPSLLGSPAVLSSWMSSHSL